METNTKSEAFCEICSTTLVYYPELVQGYHTACSEKLNLEGFEVGKESSTIEVCYYCGSTDLWFDSSQIGCNDCNHILSEG